MATRIKVIRHKVTRLRQQANDPLLHHPAEKIRQIEYLLDGRKRQKILELFCGDGNLTKVYKNYGTVELYDKALGTGDSFKVFHQLIGEGKKYHVIDVDPYGFPMRFFPDIFLLINKGILFLTMPKPNVTVITKVISTQMISYFGEHYPSQETIVEKIALFGLCHWRKVELVSCLDLGGVWRMAFEVEKVLATDYCGVRASRLKSNKEWELF